MNGHGLDPSVLVALHAPSVHFSQKHKKGKEKIKGGREGVVVWHGVSRAVFSI